MRFDHLVYYVPFLGVRKLLRRVDQISHVAERAAQLQRQAETLRSDLAALQTVEQTIEGIKGDLAALMQRVKQFEALGDSFERRIELIHQNILRLLAEREETAQILRTTEDP
jgi:uncharacterized protein Yka (UPF0111/DUF47 family)